MLEILNSMTTLQSRGLVPFLSPMLESEPGIENKIGSKQFQIKDVCQINFDKIQKCVDYVSKQVPEIDRAIAIKLTAFIPILQLVSFKVRCAMINVAALYLSKTFLLSLRK